MSLPSVRFAVSADKIRVLPAKFQHASDQEARVHHFYIRNALMSASSFCVRAHIRAVVCMSVSCGV
jgi:hypothetical protein